MRPSAAAPLVILLLLVAGCGSVHVPRAQSRPNVVVLMTDDQTLASLRVMSGVRSQLAAGGTTFDNAFVEDSLCCPSRSTFLTGQYTHNHGVLGNRPPEGGYGRLDKREYLPIWLQRAGYHTVHIGKFLNRYGQDSLPTEVPPGWSEWYGSVDPYTYRYTGYVLNENGSLNTYERYSTDEYTQRAVDAIARLAPSSTPFFLNVWYLAPHAGGPVDPDDPRQPGGTPSPAPRHRDAFATAPLPRSPAFNEADVSDKPAIVRSFPRLRPARIAAIAENYRQELETLLAVDEGVVRIVQALRDAGELDDTLIVFTSDNGFFHGEHRLPTGKVMLYEPSIRVPLILRGPGVPRGAHRRQLVTNADLAPTILAATGARPGRVQDGRSLFPLLRDPGLEWGRDLLIEGPDGLRMIAFAALRTYRYVYAEYDTGEQELYDLARDPGELRSLDGDPRYQALEAELSERLAALEVCAGPTCRRPPHVHLRLRSCRPRVTGPGIAKVRLGRLGGRLRARVTTRDGRVVTLDRRLPPHCARGAG
jgi:N-acetylglucosamine-6-sulfatase